MARINLTVQSPHANVLIADENGVARQENWLEASLEVLVPLAAVMVV